MMPHLRILVCGPRDWTDERLVHSWLSGATSNYEARYTILHGACPTGVDAFADAWARDAGVLWAEARSDGVPWAEATRPMVERYPADWKKHGKAAGPMRNQAMVDSEPSMVVAFAWVDEDGRIMTPGTRDCVARALRAGIVVHVVAVLWSDQRAARTEPKEE